MYLIESMMPSSLNVCTTLILFSRAWTGDSSYFSTLLIKVPGTLLPVTMYCFSNSIHKSFAGPGTRHMSWSKVTVFCLRISPTLGTLIALRSEELCDLLIKPPTQHVVVGLPTCVVGGKPTTTCCCWYILQPTPPTPTHQGISWVFPFLMRGFPSVILITRVFIFARDDSHVVIVSPPLGVLGPFYELQVPFYRYTYALIT